MLTRYTVTCGNISHTIRAAGSCDAIARAIPLFGVISGITARRA